MKLIKKCLQDSIWVVGFDNKDDFNYIYDSEKLGDCPILWLGKIEEIKENMAKEYVPKDSINGPFGLELLTAGETLKKVCPTTFGIIYLTN